MVARKMLKRMSPVIAKWTTSGWSRKKKLRKYQHCRSSIDVKIEILDGCTDQAGNKDSTYGICGMALVHWVIARPKYIRMILVNELKKQCHYAVRVTHGAR